MMMVVCLRHTPSLLSVARGTLRFPPFGRHPRLTRIMRKMPQLGIFPNLLHFVPQTSHNPDVMLNFKFLMDCS